MISITRSLVRQLRAVFRLALPISASSSMAAVMFRTGRDGLHVAAQLPGATAIYHQPGKALVDETAVLPYSCLADCEAKKETPLTLEAKGQAQVLLSWQDGGVRQALQVRAAKEFELARLPTKWTDNEPRLLDALHEATQTAARDHLRYALDHIQLRSDGSVVGTDGHQLLVQSGFEFPWKEHVVIPGLKLFGSKELPRDAPVVVSKLEKSVALRVGPWTFVWQVPEGRFPPVDDLIKADNVTTRLRLSEVDAAFLADNLMRLPCVNEFELAVTLDLGQQVAIRAMGEGQVQPTELGLVNSTVEGERRAISSDRTFLKRAIELGCREFCLFGGKDGRVLCPGPQRTYVWMVLDEKGVIAPSTKASRIESAPSAPVQIQTTPPESVSRPEENEEVFMPRGRKPASQSQPIDEVRWRTVEPEQQVDQPTLVQAEALRDSLRDLSLKANDLISALKRQRRQEKLVASTLASLKELQKVAG